MDKSYTTQLWSALIFIISGLIFLMEEISRTDLWHRLWPLLIIATGITILWEVKNNKSNIKN